MTTIVGTVEHRVIAQAVIKRQNGTVRVIREEVQVGKDPAHIIVNRYFDEEGNEVTHNPVLAYMDIPESDRANLQF